MALGKKKIAGLIVSVGVTQAILAIIIAQSLYPKYSVLQALSDLGVGPTAPIFNISMMLLGLAFIAAAYCLRNISGGRLFAVLLALAGIFTMGVGIFPETTGAAHDFFAIMAFGLSAIVAILSSRRVKYPMSYLCVALGVLSAICLILGLSGHYLGLGFGGIERLIAYPLFIWGLCFGGYLLGEKE